MINDQQARLRLLLEKYLASEQSREEYSELAELMLEYNSEELTDLLEELLPDEQFRDLPLKDRSWQQSMLQVLRSNNPLHKASVARKPFYRLPALRSRYKIGAGYAAAAILLIAAGLTCWLLLNRPPSPPVARKSNLPATPSPVSNIPDNCGLVEPTAGDTKTDTMIHIDINGSMHTLSISPGWQFHTTLSDGTEVTLNTASSVTYPGTFEGRETREVEVQGEVFFDVAKNKKQPFFVKAKGVVLQALGTSFNVNAYGDKDSIYTTLVSGSLKAVKGTNSALLKPGQRASVALNDTTIKVDKANLAATGMWKEGYFNFTESRVKEVMQELSRWYKWEVSYAPGAKPVSFSGTFCRRTPEAEVLQVLRDKGIRFQKTGNKITIE